MTTANEMDIACAQNKGAPGSGDRMPGYATARVEFPLRGSDSCFRSGSAWHRTRASLWHG